MAGRRKPQFVLRYGRVGSCVIGLVCALLFWFPFAAQAQLPGAPLNVPASLEAETLTPAPGKTVTLAFHFKPNPGWHGYWSNPGDAGFGMQLDWSLPKGVAAGELRYPVPQPLVISGLMNHVFEQEYAVLVDLSVDKNVARGAAIPISVAANWLACTDEICVPEAATLKTVLTIGDGAIPAMNQKQFDIWRGALPVPMDQAARYQITGNGIEIAIPIARGAAVDQPYFFPATEKLFRYAAPQRARRVGDWLILSGAVSGPFSDRIKGVLRIGDTAGLEVVATPGIIPAGGVDVPVYGQSFGDQPSNDKAQTQGILVILGFAILGGLILNLMPCVFPILGLKAVALAKAGGNEMEARRDALAYTAGIVISCIALGGVMIMLRALGQEIGWAFQLQEPLVLLALLLLMAAVTANLAGLFEITGFGAGGQLARKDGVAGAFWTGVLAAIVATPCTGPFMATAMGAALLLPPLAALLIFAGLGFGLALPFLVIAFVPAMRRWLPRPGPWMVTFRKVMAVPMGMTALALLWLLWRVSGWQGLMVGAVSGLLVLLLLIWLGKKEPGSATQRITLAIIGVAAASAMVLHYAGGAQLGGPQNVAKNAFSEDRLARLRAANVPVFVYFTADWCVTCKLNEANAINTDATRASFRRNNVVILVGDYTRRDPAITRFLNKHGRSGVPLYLFYPVKGEPQILAQILTTDSLNAEVESQN